MDNGQIVTSSVKVTIYTHSFYEYFDISVPVILSHIFDDDKNAYLFVLST